MQTPKPCQDCGEICTATNGLCRKCYKKRWYNNAANVSRRPRTREDKLLKPAQVSDSARIGFDFARQERRPAVEGKAQTAMYILARCTVCGKERWVSHKKARTYRNPYCFACNLKLTYRGGPKGKGWFISSGYKIIDITRFYPSEADYIRQHLEPDSCHYGNFYREHRVVALLTYGPDLVKPGVLIRHLDGNKLNNAPSNLAPGTPKENSIDHAEAVAEMKRWRAIALMLFDALCRHESPVS